MTASGNFFRRRKFVIRKKLQYGLLAATFSYIALVVLVIAISLFLPLMLDMGRIEGSTDRTALAARFILYLHSNFWPPALFALAAIALHSIMTSHRIAGPLHRILLFSRDLTKGKIPQRINLRKGDYLHEEVDEINRAAEALRVRLREIDDIREDLEQCIVRHKDQITASSGEGSLTSWKDVTDKLETLKNKIKSFEHEDG